MALRVLAERLAGARDVTVGVLTHPQSNLADFYREMADPLPPVPQLRPIADRGDDVVRLAGARLR